ncbi:thyroid adenoma-associated protein isoform X1 [Cetorhinus maximus]
MVLKKKKDTDVGRIVLDEHKLARLRLTDEENGLGILLLECAELNDGIQQLQLLKKIGSLLRKLGRDSVHNPQIDICLEILVRIYWGLESRSPLKRATASALSGISENLEEEVVNCLVNCLREELLTVDKLHVRKVIDSIAACMENFSLGEKCVQCLYLEVLQFLHTTLVDFKLQNKSLGGQHILQNKLMHDSLVAMKAAMVLVQKVQEKIHDIFCKNAEPRLWEAMCGLLTCFIEILLDGDFLQIVQSTAGMAALLFIKTIVDCDELLPKLVFDLLFNSMQRAHDVPGWLIQSCGQLYNAVPPDDAVLFLSQGSLAMLDWRSGRMRDSGEHLLLGILTVLLSLNTRLKESSMAMSVSRILSLWTTSALDALHSDSCSQYLKNSLNGNSEAIQKLLEYIWTHWEHPLDGVRHQTKTIFKNILKIHQKTIDGSCGMTDPFFLNMTHSLLSLEWHIKGKYTSLSCLVEYLGTEYILTVDDSVPKQVLGVMLEQSLATYASDLLEKMFVSHKNQLMSSSQSNNWIKQWHEIWVSPFLATLCEEKPSRTTYLIEYYLPKLLKCNPDSLTYMIKELQSSDKASNIGPFNSRGALGALMTCLRAARAQGLWSTADEFAWNQLIPISLIKQALVHKHEQVRLDALGLVCETHRSTETLSQQEIALIKFFLPYNLNSQTPAMRQQIVWLMRKLFSRLRDSSQVLYKQTQTVNRQKNILYEEKSKSQHPEVKLQQYKDFMVWVCDRLLQALIPGASFPRKFIVLNLLGIIADVFENFEGQTYRVMQMTEVLQPAYVDSLLGCLNSTFEELKLLAYDFLKKLPATILGLQDGEKLQTLLQTALDLSTSTKPYDCITASYILALLVQQEGLLPALRACSLIQQTSYQFDDFSKVHGKQPADKEILETNILEVIKFLLNCLSDEIRQAERSLVHTAATNPLYGRVHCIIGALQQLSLKSVSKIAEWRETVAELILMAFHLSAVVSPICQSSSPEGLIPMDTDLETAENLQRILNEIKPRDTNDYFAQAKLLKTDEDRESSKNTSEDCKPSENLSMAMTDRTGQSCQVTAQMVLVCCWRSMKEISLLLGLLCQNLPLQSTPDSKDGLLTFNQVGEIGEYFKCQLLQSRHRGAFELAYVGFVKLTEMLTSCNNRDLQKLPQQWLEEVLQEIKSSSPASKLCATRRSAGIPFYIQALVSSEPRGSNLGFLKLTMKELISLALPLVTCQDEPATIPQVHALNILRALFRDTRLGENVIPYVADGIQAAILGFTSPIWAVRNSSTLLFSALITRVFGVKRGKDEHSKKNRMTGREFFTRFPTLYPFLLKQLEMVANTMDSDSGVLKLHPSLFLLLLVLGRLYPSPLDGTCSALSLAPFVPFIIRCGHSPVHRSREMAARALVPFVAVDRILPMAQSLLETLPAPTDLYIQQNQIHGTLLQALHLLRSYFDSKQRTNSSLHQELHDIIGCTRAKIWLATRQNPCLLTRATFFDVINILCHYLNKSKTIDPEILSFWQTTHHIILESELFTDEQKFFPVPGLIQWQRNITKLTLSVLAISVSLQTMSLSPGTIHELTSRTEVQSSLFLSHLLHSEFLEVRLLTLETVLLWLEEMDSNQVRETNGNVLFLLSQVEDTLKKLAVQEKHPECLAKVLKILCHLNIETLFPWTVSTSVMTEAKLLKWILSIAETIKNSIEMQSVTLTLASKLVIHLVLKKQEKSLNSITQDLRQWVHLVAQSCGVEQQTEIRLTAAKVLIDAAPSLLANKQLYFDLLDTLTLWKCIFTLLQDEEQVVRDKATNIIQMIPPSLEACKEDGILFSVVNPSLAMDLGLGVLCELIQIWNQTSRGIVTLIEWMLGEEDMEEDETNEDLGEYDMLFDKGEFNLWAEKITFANLLRKHLSALISQSHAVADNELELHRLTMMAANQAQHVAWLLKGLPPAPEFSRTVDHTRLSIQKVRLLNISQLLRLFGLGAVIAEHF